jgi:hypothetical protein
VAVGVPVAHLAEDAVDVGDVDVSAFQLAPGGVEAGGVEGLLVLAPADVADEALVVDEDALAAEGQLQLAARRPGQLQAVELGDVRVVDDRIGRLAVQAGGDARDLDVVVLRTDLADVLELDQALEAVPVAGLPAQAGAQGQGLGGVGQARRSVCRPRWPR